MLVIPKSEVTNSAVLLLGFWFIRVYETESRSSNIVKSLSINKQSFQKSKPQDPECHMNMSTVIIAYGAM